MASMSGDKPGPLELRKVQSFLQKTREENRVFVHSYDNVYILSDSKGKYLQREENSVKDLINTDNVHFWHRGGRNTESGVQFLEDKIRQRGVRHGRSIVLFWHLTCDVNEFKLPERWLMPRFSSGEEFLESVKPSIDRLLEIHGERENIDIGILEAPPVFWSKWNQINHHPEWNTFTDGKMHEQLDVVNSYVRNVNGNLNYLSPKFFIDCMETRKRKSSLLPGHRKSLSSVLLVDGVHPVKEISQKWLFQIVKSVCI